MLRNLTGAGRLLKLATAVSLALGAVNVQAQESGHPGTGDAQLRY